ncbi:hypothetical protein [Streptomyces qinzhouensis]|uniref:Uncharacterized protein n=1 Tax=Streptomyces qinzhouensis TaxID=2599401 RepID=A0A5B8JFY1_9ACTN|nr:hypothetical protein [Streptomyces qinzhouensis]QDY76630.1 hypothetical protein FQU76_08880 [Streptomyces qinzhouensis]
MRTWYQCLACESHYLPPESMTYPSHPGVTANPVHCTTHRCRERAERIVAASGMPMSVFEAMAIRAAARAEASTPASTTRRARGGRSASGPGSARSRLG